MGHAEKLLNAAAAPTLRRIRHDQQNVSHQLRPLLSYIEAHLFDPALDVNQLKRACGVRDNTLPLTFHEMLSLPPYAYIEDCRLEVACRLLRDTDLQIWRIAQVLGYSSVQVFSRAFDRWSGLRPSVYRLRAAREAEKIVVHESVSADAALCLMTLRKAVTGGLGRDEAEDLARQLFRLYPESFCQVSKAFTV